MDEVADSSIWVDYLRPTTKKSIKLLANEVISRSSLALCEPVCFELLRLAPLQSRKVLENTFSIIPMLETPLGLWRQATKNGQRCRDKGIQTAALDLLIGTICMHHEAVLVTFDIAFENIGKILGFKVELLRK